MCCQSLEGMSVVDAGNFTVVCRYIFAVGEIIQERFVYFNDMFHLPMRYFFGVILMILHTTVGARMGFGIGLLSHLCS